MTNTQISLKKGADRRAKSGHPWIFSNEINIALTPIKGITSGTMVTVVTHDGIPLGVGYLNPQSLISIRLMGTADQTIDEAFIHAKLQHALLLRQQLFSKPYYRLVYGDSDGLPGLVIDRFDDHFVLQINTAGMEQLIPFVVSALRSLFSDDIAILLKNDSAMREYEGLPVYVKPIHGIPAKEITMEENDTKFIIPLWEGQKTGWFYDHRLNRARLQSYVANRSVLDCFSYLGGWGIQAARFGASEVDCIDASAFACGYIEKNAALNGVADKVTVSIDDAFIALKKRLQAKRQYDVIILDPPAFVKRAKDMKEGMLAYQRLNEIAVKLLKPDGILITCSCSMQVSEADLLEMLQRVAFRTQTSLQVIERGHQGPDHPLHLNIPETNYLKAIIVRKG